MAHPLTKEDLDQINSSLDGIKATKDIIVRAKASGIDVEAQSTALDTAEAALRAIKQGFFPSGRA